MVVNLATQVQIQLSTASNQHIMHLATWGPEGNSIIYIHNNNIYYRPHIEKSSEIQLTGDGEPGRIYFGVPDWVYEGL